MRLLTGFLLSVGLSAQVPTMPSTFTSAPITNQSTGIPSFQNCVSLLNPGLIGSSYLTVNQATGLPYGSNGALLVIDIEGMRVQSKQSTGQPCVSRGSEGTRSFAHGALARVWVASYRYFWPRNPMGVCQPATQLVTPAVAIPSGSTFDCEGDGTWAGATFSWVQAGISGYPTTYPATSSQQPFITWGNATSQGVWIQVYFDQGTWSIADLAWQSATWPWKDTATTAPQIVNVLP